MNAAKHFMFGRFTDATGSGGGAVNDSATSSDGVHMKEDIPSAAATVVSSVVLKSDPATYQEGMFTPNMHDRGVLKLRRWISEKAQGGPVWGNSPLVATVRQSGGVSPVLPPEQLFDVYESHVKSCTVCQAALTNVKRVRIAALLGLAVMAVLLKRSRPWAGIGAVVCGAVAWAANKYAKLFYKFEYSHQNNP